MDISEQITILTVHYQTPNFLKRLLTSIRKFYPSVLIMVMDGSDQPDFQAQTKELCSLFPPLHLEQFGYNINHGPGITHGMEQVETDYAFILDTDDYFLKPGLLEAMLPLMENDTYGIGKVFHLGRNMDHRQGDPPMEYLHPSGMLINRKVFFQYRTPHDHGAPMIHPMQDLQDAGKDTTCLIDFGPMYDFVCREKRGTTKRWPNLAGWPPPTAKIKRAKAIQTRRKYLF